MTKPYIIGEAGSCHEEILERAVDLIQVANVSGCSAVKFQYWSTPKRMRERRHVKSDETFERGSIKESWFPVLRNEAHARGIQFLCTAYLPEDVPLVSAYVDAFKIASFENSNRPLMHAVARHAIDSKRQVFLSLGMQRAATTYQFFPWSAAHPEPVVTFHCVTSYPCPPDQANLGAIRQGGGYSDHTRVVFAGGLAVAAGADYLEVHYRLDGTSPDCPDYCVALSPDELARYVEFARMAYMMRGTGHREAQTCELPNLVYAVEAGAD